MDNTSLPPNQKPNPNPLQTSPDVPGLPPGTFEYVDENKKRNWKRIIEIAIVVVIAAVPLTMSLFKPEYSFEKSYAVLNPASYVNGESYQIWGSIITTAKNIIQPETKQPQEDNKQTVSLEETIPTDTPTPTLEPEKEPTQTPQEAAYPTLSKEQIDVFTQFEEEPTAYPTKQYIFYPTSPASNQENEEEPTVTPTNTPSATSTPQTSPYAACSGKHKNDKCAYTLYSGNKVEGKCKTAYGGSLICVKD